MISRESLDSICSFIYKWRYFGDLKINFDLKIKVDLRNLRNTITYEKYIYYITFVYNIFSVYKLFGWLVLNDSSCIYVYVYVLDLIFFIMPAFVFFLYFTILFVFCEHVSTCVLFYLLFR